MRRLPIIAVWLLLGHALVLALFWGLLQVPESSIGMLTLSGLLGVMIVATAGTVHAGAVNAWRADGPVSRALLAGTRHVPAFLLSLTLFGLVWLATNGALEWHARLAGQMDAAVIAQTGRTNTSWMHGAIFWAVQFIRWSLGLSLALSLFAALVRIGLRGAGRTAWVRAALTPGRWLVLTFWFVLLIAIPWQVVYWRPARLGLGVEPWFVAAKLGSIAVAMAIGWALMLRSAARE